MSRGAIEDRDRGSRGGKREGGEARGATRSVLIRCWAAVQDRDTDRFYRVRGARGATAAGNRWHSLRNEPLTANQTDSR